MLPFEVKDRITSGITSEAVYVNEFSGGTDHYEVIVVSKEFEGLISLKRSRLIMDLFRAEIDTGEVHALSIKAFTPTQWEEEKENYITLGKI